VEVEPDCPLMLQSHPREMWAPRGGTIKKTPNFPSPLLSLFSFFLFSAIPASSAKPKRTALGEMNGLRSLV